MPNFPNDPDTSFNAGYTAIPRDMALVDDPNAFDDPPFDAALDPGTMNEADARESGYVQGPSAEVPAFNAGPLTTWQGAVLGALAGAALWYLFRSGRREREVPSWLTAEAMSPVD